MAKKQKSFADKASGNKNKDARSSEHSLGLDPGSSGGDGGGCLRLTPLQQSICLLQNAPTAGTNTIISDFV